MPHKRKVRTGFFYFRGMSAEEVLLEDEIDDGVDYWKEFQLGTRAVFQKWTAMRMAVEHGWGGRDSAEKEEDLILEIIDLLG